jgi:autotransporter-associated beta strand protein
MLKTIYSLLAAVALVAVVSAADNVWVGNDNQSNGAWSRTGNWTNNTSPNFQTNNRIVFQNNLTSTNMLYDLGGWISSSDIIWASTFNVSRNLTSTGGGIDFATRLENLSSYTQTVSMNLSGGKFGASDIQLNPVNGDLVINGTIYNDNSLGYSIWGNTGRTLTLNSTLGPNATQSGVSFTMQRNTTVEVNTNQLWQGTTTMNGGILRVGASGLLGDGNYSGAVALNSYNGNNASLVFSNSRSQTMSGGISGAGSLTQAGTGTTTLTGSNSYTGRTTVAAGRLVLSGAYGSTNFSIGTNSTLQFNATSGILDGATTVFSGSGVLLKTGGGTLQWASTTNKATFAMSAGSLIDVQAGVFKAGSDANEVWTNNQSSLNVAGGASFLGVEANVRVDALSGSGAITSGFNGAGYSNFTFGVANGSGTFTGTIGNGSAAGNFVKAGSGTQVLSGNNTYTGTTTISGGTLQIGNGGTMGSLGSGAVVANGTLAFNRSDAVTVSNAISGSGSVVHSGTGTTTLAAANTYSGLTRVSSGTMALGAAGSLATNSSAQVDSGASLNLAAKNQTLADVKVNGTVSGSGSLMVTGTLSGSGTINPDTVVAGTHSPGNSPGIQTFEGNLTYQPGSTMVWQLIANTTSNSLLVYDQVIVGGNLTFNGATTLQLVFNDIGSLVNWTDSLWSSNQSWTIYQVSGATTGLNNFTIASGSLFDAYGNDFATTLAGSSFSITQNGQNVTLTYTVPEPSTYALFGLGALALVIAVRRKRAA